MKKAIVIGFIALAAVLGEFVLPTNIASVSMVEKVEAAVRVKGYTKKNGTYVAPHYRSNPDGNPYNNWSYPGNTNPYTEVTAPGNADT